MKIEINLHFIILKKNDIVKISNSYEGGKRKWD